MADIRSTREYRVLWTNLRGYADTVTVAFRAMADGWAEDMRRRGCTNVRIEERDVVYGDWREAGDHG